MVKCQHELKQKLDTWDDGIIVPLPMSSKLTNRLRTGEEYGANLLRSR